MTYDGVVQNGVVVLPPDAQLADGTHVSVEVSDAAIDPLVSAMQQLAKARPHWPADYSLNHGHYQSGELMKD